MAGEEQQTTTTNKVEVAPLIPEKEPPKHKHTKELEELDALLSKAQKLRIQTKPEGEKMTKRSMRAASSVYSLDDKVDTKGKAVKQSGSGPKLGSKQIRPKQSPSVTSKLHPRAAREDKVRPQASSTGSEPTADNFSLAKKGTQLSLPSKYSKLKHLITKCEEALAGDKSLIVAKAAATHFSMRLLSKSSSDLNAIPLQLAANKLDLLREKLMLISPQEWTMLERKSWEEVLYIKTKLDLLMRSYNAILSELGSKATPTGHTHHLQTLLEGDDTTGSSHHHTLQEFGYTSLQDWNLLSQRLLQKRFKEWEGRFLVDTQQLLLPLAARAMASCSSPHNHHHHQDPPHSVVSALQAIYAAAGLRVYPAFLNTEAMLQQ